MPKYRGKQYYMGAWHYVLLDILYALPIIGLIFLLVHAFSANNENRCHYARSYFARFLLIVIILALVAGMFYLIAGQEAFQDALKDIERGLQEMTGSSSSGQGRPSAGSGLFGNGG